MQAEVPRRTIDHFTIRCTDKTTTTTTSPIINNLHNPRGGGTSYVGQYGMLGYTWVIFEKFSVLFPRDGYLFSTKFLYFFCKVDVYFEEKFCICRTRWNPFTRIFSVFYSTKLLHFTHKISVYFYMMTIFSRDLL